VAIDFLSVSLARLYLYCHRLQQRSQRKQDERVQVIAIITLCIGMAVTYGILHDQVTARVCVEYFTIGHPPIFDTESPALLGLGWGIIATWWVGALLGLPLALAARAGRHPRKGVRSLVRPIFNLLLVMGVCALIAGLVGFALATSGVVYLLEPLATDVPRPRHARFLADLWAHSASYFAGFVGGLMVIVRVWRSRSRQFVVMEASKGQPDAAQAPH
jgi:hypothetical protein